MTGFDVDLGSYKEQIQNTLASLNQQGFSKRLWAKDPTLWKSDPDLQEKIRNRLGWLTLFDTMQNKAGEIMDFAQSIQEAGFTRVVLLGMGGSSLCPEVCRKIYGVTRECPDLTVLDSTDPATILSVGKKLDLNKTLFIVASKSGTTLEVQSLYRYFFEKVKAIEPSRTGQNFVGITDPDTPLERLARKQNFRKLFLNPPDIGGRYSALSYFGLVPAALIGMDLEVFWERARHSVSEYLSGVHLGVILGELAKAGRDKVTLVISPPIQSFGIWLEQLLAESTGKEGKGLVPVVGEPVGTPSVYGHDRVFIYLKLSVSPDPGQDSAVEALKQVGHPVVQMLLRDSMDLAGEFFRWELATATAGAILGINPFDEPNVTESKENTLRILQALHSSGRLDLPTPILETEGIRLYGDLQREGSASLRDVFQTFFHQSKAGDYVALLAYLQPSKGHEAILQRIRLVIRDRFHLASTLGYGPRYLHSTGQLHKGGAPIGLFLQITAEDPEDVSIPGEKYTFGILKLAQALGDFCALTSRGLRALHIHLGRNAGKDLKKLLECIETVAER
jgi:glucose-6-phosphate isomerase